MLSRLFRAHGSFCASHPWEVIVATFTLTCCMMSFSMFAGNPRICGWNYKCENSDMKSSDILILMMIRCIAVLYIYIQFKNLRRLGSKYLIGIAGVLTVFSSFVFSTAVVHLIGSDLTGLNEALPFFLILVDLSKACALARFALNGKSEDAVKKGIADGMAVLGPNMTLDVLVETLSISIGTFSGIKQLDTMCCFGVLSVVTNYFAFMTFYPACLALVLDVSAVQASKGAIWRLLDEEQEEKTNPVTQRVKVIMSAGLVLVHVSRSWLMDRPSSIMSQSDLSDQLTGRMHSPEVSLWKFYLSRIIDLNVDYSLTLALALVLAAKYVLYDKDEEEATAQPIKSALKKTSVVIQQVEATPASSDVPQTEPVQDVPDTRESTPDEKGEGKPRLFSIGPTDDSDSDTETQADAATQTECDGEEEEGSTISSSPRPAHSLEQCLEIMKSDEGPNALSDEEIRLLVKKKHIPAYKLEGVLDNHERGVAVRRSIMEPTIGGEGSLSQLPYRHYDYSLVTGACCENVVGFIPVPVGLAGPLLLDGQEYHVPMATTEGCLVASTNRGCRALSMSGGAHSSLLSDGMTRAPVVRLPTAQRASAVKKWLEQPENFATVKEAFDSTSRFGRLQRCQVTQSGRLLFVRFVSSTGDAMGMNMVSKGSEKALNKTAEVFDDLEILSLSGNYCTDKKPAAINWIEGRGKSVVCEAVVPSEVVKKVLKTEVSALLDLNISKNLIGSAMAGSIGGFNAHSANIVTAVFIACGQDPAQVVTSANCMTQMEPSGPNGQDLRISCTMPSIEVGTVGGGTALGPQGACLAVLGIKGAHLTNPGENAATLARIVCATVLAGELSLMSALAAGHLVRSHMKYNRSSAAMVTAKPLGCIAEQDESRASSPK